MGGLVGGVGGDRGRGRLLRLMAFAGHNRKPRPPVPQYCKSPGCSEEAYRWTMLYGYMCRRHFDDYLKEKRDACTADEEAEVEERQ
jgi:hypothetical protein